MENNVREDERVRYGEKNTNGCKTTNGGQSIQDDPRHLIPELCRHFYHLGWASGTGGGLAIRQNGRIYCPPSGVQKERIKPEDMFVLDEKTSHIIERPQDDKLKCSECLSLFMVCFSQRQAGCCIHSHSIHANLVTSLHSKNGCDSYGERWRPPAHERDVLRLKSEATIEFRIKNQEMIKGIKIGSTGKNLKYDDCLIVPIIENQRYERDLVGALEEAVTEYPDTNAVLVRNHGVYVWGETWQQAKTMAECYDYLFKLKLEAHRSGFDWMMEY